MANLLLEKQLIDKLADAGHLASLSSGSLEQAMTWADDELEEFRVLMLSEISSKDFDSVGLAKSLNAFVDAAGKKAPPKRARMIQLMSIASNFYRELLRGLAGLEAHGDEITQRFVSEAMHSFDGDFEFAAACVDRCVAAEAQVRANANQATLLDCWIDDLATLSRGQVVG